tara:strand:- start:335 stop:499 length:165 start_codon:yes stop_codon:yes gene_type:complete
MGFTFAYLAILVLLLGLVIRKQINKIESKSTIDEKAILIAWLFLGVIGLFTGSL